MRVISKMGFKWSKIECPCDYLRPQAMKYTKHDSFTEHAGAVYALAQGRQPHTFFSASADKHVVEWNSNSQKQEPFVVKLEQAAYSILYDQESGKLFIGNALGGLHVIDAESKQELRYFTTHTNGIYDFALDQKRGQLIVAGGDGFLSVWNISTLELVRNIPLCNMKLRQLAVNVEENSIAVACGDGCVRILDLDFFNEQQTIAAHEEGATSVAWHPTKSVLLSGGKDAHLKVWNMKDAYKCVLSIPAHNYAIYSIAFGHSICATASRDKTIKIWDAQSFDSLQRLDAKSGGHSHSVNKILFQNEKLISCGDDRQIIIWNKE